MKRLLCVGLLFTTSTFAQVSSETEFTRFALLPVQSKLIYMSDEGWNGLGTEQGTLNNGMVYSDMKYSKLEGEDDFELTIRNVMTESGAMMSVTTVVLTNEATYNRWIKNWKSSGHKFTKDLSGGDKYLSAQDDYVIYIEKENAEGIELFIISIVI